MKEFLGDLSIRSLFALRNTLLYDTIFTQGQIHKFARARRKRLILGRFSSS